MTVEMEYARFVEEDGGTQLVRLPSVLNRSVIPYDPDKHHGSIICDECDAGVHYRKEKHSIGGSKRFRASDHFALMPHERHNLHCRHINPESRIENSLFDSHPDNGYRLHFNPDTDLTGDFNAESIYYRDENQKMRARRMYLPARETEKSFMCRAPRSLRSLGDFLDLMQKGDIERLKKSYVVSGTHVIRLNRFVIREGRTTEEAPNPKFCDFASRLRAKNVPADGLPAIMEVEIKEPVRPDFFEDNFRVNAKAVYLDTQNNNKRFALPKIHVESKGDCRIKSLFEEAGRYSVIGLVRPYRLDSGNLILNMRLTDLAQVDRRLSSEIFEARKDEIDAARIRPPEAA